MTVTVTSRARVVVGMETMIFVMNDADIVVNDFSLLED